MKLHKLNNFTRGWIVGNFLPSLIETDKFEFGIRKYKAGEVEEKHVHKIVKEITITVSGKFEMNGKILKEGDIIELNPGEPTDFKCIESGYTAVIKTPSITNDKYLIN